MAPIHLAERNAKKKTFNFCLLISNRNILVERKCQNRTALKLKKRQLYNEQVTKKLAELQILRAKAQKQDYTKQSMARNTMSFVGVRKR